MSLQIIVGNVDCEAQCGEPERRDRTACWESSVVAQRLLWLSQTSHDLFVMPAAVSPEMLGFVGGTLNVSLGRENVVVPYADRPTLLTEAEMAKLRLTPSGMRGDVVPYFVDRGLAAFCVNHNLSFPWPDYGTLEPLNRKSHFRELAHAYGIPVAQGHICTSEAELTAAMETLLPLTGTVIVKQDLAGGGEGNVAVTLTKTAEFLGASRTLNVLDRGGVRARAPELFRQLTGPLNHTLVVEAYSTSRMVIYSEVMAGAREDEDVLLNWGRMLMEPTWVGFEIPGFQLDPALVYEFSRFSIELAERIGATGYRGRMNCDAIITDTGQLLFTEINVRLGGCTHIDVLARRLLGQEYMNDYVLKSRNGIAFSGTIGKLLERIEPLRFSSETNTGVLVMTEALNSLGTFEALCIARSLEEARELESLLLQTVGEL